MDGTPPISPEAAQVRQVLERWAEATRTNRLDDVLADHATEALIYDVLPPVKHEGAEAYRRSWGDWQPETTGGERFEWQDLAVVVDGGLAFACGFIHCGGILPSGKTFEDLVRATFCLRRQDGAWKVIHQHISKPFHS
jgi:ketosteroid isomerase-like protein